MAKRKPDVRPMPKSDMELAPCGCRFGTVVLDGEPTFVFEPCSLSCPTYAYVIEETNAQQMPKELRYVKETP